MHFENCADIDGFLKLGHIYCNTIICDPVWDNRSYRPCQLADSILDQEHKATSINHQTQLDLSGLLLIAAFDGYFSQAQWRSTRAMWGPG